MQTGIKFTLSSMSEEHRIQYFQAARKFSYHKLVLRYKTLFMNELNNGIKLGYALPLLEENTAKIYNVQITPYGLLTQKEINELGEIIPKDRITYLLCFPEKNFF